MDVSQTTNNDLKFDDEEPGQHAGPPDDQGKDPLCTHQSLGKALVDGYEDGTYKKVSEGKEKKKKMNFNQKEAMDELVNLYSSEFLTFNVEY